VIEVSGESGPEAVGAHDQAGVKQGQAVPAPVLASAETAPVPLRIGGKALAFSALVIPPQGITVLAADMDWTTNTGERPNLGPTPGFGQPFAIAGRQVFVVSVASFPARSAELPMPSPSRVDFPFWLAIAGLQA